MLHHAPFYTSKCFCTLRIRNYNENVTMCVKKLCGRDHGLPGYTKYREYCGGSVLSYWSQDTGPEDITQRDWDNMKSVYKYVQDIDAFTGAMSEKAVDGGLVGATLACIIGKQFKALMEGDR